MDKKLNIFLGGVNLFGAIFIPMSMFFFIDKGIINTSFPVIILIIGSIICSSAAISFLIPEDKQ
jgi:hypothetical protein